MRLQYFVSVEADTEEVKQLLSNKLEVSSLPFNTDLKGMYYKTSTSEKKAYIVIEEGQYMNVFY